MTPRCAKHTDGLEETCLGWVGERLCAVCDAPAKAMYKQRIVHDVVLLPMPESFDKEIMAPAVARAREVLAQLWEPKEGMRVRRRGYGPTRVVGTVTSIDPEKECPYTVVWVRPGLVARRHADRARHRHPLVRVRRRAGHVSSPTEEEIALAESNLAEAAKLYAKSPSNWTALSMAAIGYERITRAKRFAELQERRAKWRNDRGLT